MQSPLGALLISGAAVGTAVFLVWSAESIRPVVTRVLSNRLPGELMTPLQWLGALPVMAGVALVTIRPSR